jgi:hypothetical protein
VYGPQTQAGLLLCVGWTGSEAIKGRLNGLIDGYPGIFFVVWKGM